MGRLVTTAVADDDYCSHALVYPEVGGQRFTRQRDDGLQSTCIL